MKKHTIYVIGVVILGLLHTVLKSNFNTYAFVGIAIGYLLLLNVIAHRYGKPEKNEEP